ncbi:MAG: hypothetical protein GQ561_00065 [Calditrichae bacterium]|nr:hypothetical protein [Calditrichia bacterium]
MKNLMISIIIGGFIATGFSQSQKTETKKYDAPQNGPIIEKVQGERDYYSEMQRSAEKKKKESFNFQQGKIAVVKDMERTNQKSKYHSAANAKPKQVLNTNRPKNFGQGKEQIYSKNKTRKKLGRVEGYAPREEMKKIDVHPPVSEEVLIQALGNPKPIQKQSN